jgi:hypothetical protein
LTKKLKWARLSAVQRRSDEIKTGILWGLLFCAIAAQAQTNKTQSLTLEQAIQMAIEHNLSLKIQRYIPALDQFTLGAVYGSAYEPAFNATAKDSYSANPGTIYNGLLTPNQHVDDQNLPVRHRQRRRGQSPHPVGLAIQPFLQPGQVGLPNRSTATAWPRRPYRGHHQGRPQPAAALAEELLD